MLDWNENDIQRQHTTKSHYVNPAVSKVSSIFPWFYCLQVAVVLDSLEEKDVVTDLRGTEGMHG